MLLCACCTLCVVLCLCLCLCVVLYVLQLTLEYYERERSSTAGGSTGDNALSVIVGGTSQGDVIDTLDEGKAYGYIHLDTHTHTPTVCFRHSDVCSREENDGKHPRHICYSGSLGQVFAVMCAFVCACVCVCVCVCVCQPY